MSLEKIEICKDCHGNGCYNCSYKGWTKISSEEIIIINLFNDGYIKLLNMMGNDFTPVERARVSYGKGLTTYDKDKKLLEYLYNHGHFSPLEGIIFEFELKIPIFVARQLMRYRIASYNEISGRYTDNLKNEFYLPDNYRTNDNVDKQNSIIIDDNNKKEQMNQIIKETYDYIQQSYNKLREMGVAKELARIIQPVGQYTDLRLTINLRNLLHIFSQRLSDHAQYETKFVVQNMYDIVKQVIPLNIELYDKYKNNF